MALFHLSVTQTKRSAGQSAIREMLGYEQISLEEDEFTTQWKAIATEEERDSFLKEHTSIMTDAGELTLSGQSYYEDPIGETAYNSYTKGNPLPKPRENGLQGWKTRYFYRPGQKVDICPTFVHQR